LIIAVDVVEKPIVGVFHHKSVAVSLLAVGSDSALEAVLRGTIIAFALLPYFAFKEIDLRIGEGRLRAMLFGGIGIGIGIGRAETLHDES
jgi:hypothetical protein